ncbi:hypothetical protein ADK18_00850 [Bacillus anthracis]|nr:hypothetical protein ADK18_00850 [Bacillus anthracis]
MVINFLRTDKRAAFILLFLRLYIGYTWLTAGIGKLQGKAFDATGYLKGAIEKAKGEQPAVQTWWAEFLQHFAIPNADLFNTLVKWGEILVGIGLIVGGLTKTAAFFGIIMNLAYILSGTIRVNPKMLILTMFILVAGKNAGKYGIRRLRYPKTFP